LAENCVFFTPRSFGAPASYVPFENLQRS